jgi:murein L,D-transpeptidase YafK
LTATRWRSAGCVTIGDPKHLHPVPVTLVAAMQSKGMAVTDSILIRVFKKRTSSRTGSATGQASYALLKTHPVCRGSGQLGRKMEKADRRTPEGSCTVRASQMNLNSAFYLSFDLGFLNELDRALAQWDRSRPAAS